MVDPASLAHGADRPLVLLIEDEPELRRSLLLLLRGRGFAVRSYASAHALLADPASSDATCLISDYLMPELNGIELLESLRARGWKAPAVLITAFPSPALTARATEAGYDQIVTKPFLHRTLADSVSRLIKTGMAGEDSPASTAG